MKRLFSLMLILLILTTAAGAVSEGSRCEINAEIKTGEQTYQANLTVSADEDRIRFTSSMIPDTCVQLSRIDPAQTASALSELIRNLGDDKITDTIRKCAAEWMAYMQPEIRTGMFSGDAFEQASVMEHITFSCGDLMLLSQRIRKSLTEKGIEAVLLESDWSELMMPERNIRFDLKIFDGGKYVSVNVLDGENIVATVSANLSDPDCILLITGCGYGGKNYYSRILAEIKEGRLDITEMLYADDQKAGYPGLLGDSLIYTRDSTIEWAADEIKFSGCLFPANDRMTPVAWSGTLRNINPGRFFEGEIHFAGYTGISAAITADLYQGSSPETAGKVIDLDEPDEKELIALGAEIGVAVLPALISIISALPPEYAAPVSEMMGY